MDISDIANPTSSGVAAAVTVESADPAPDYFDGSGDFSSEDGLFSGKQLQSFAQSFNFDHFDYWLATDNLRGPLP